MSLVSYSSLLLSFVPLTVGRGLLQISIEADSYATGNLTAGIAVL